MVFHPAGKYIDTSDVGTRESSRSRADLLAQLGDDCDTLPSLRMQRLAIYDSWVKRAGLSKPPCTPALQRLRSATR
ncbi:hypothetical protein FHR48_000249 [Xanthomonas arboricola]|nr:hypothetical protein [Xanthomonas cannabis]NIK62753.1 hypothetical protein [Xanthomonas cannabis]